MLLSVVEPTPEGLYQNRTEDRDTIMSWTKDYLDTVEKAMTKDGITTKSVIIEGKATGVIVDYAAKSGIDLIIMSTHGRSGPSRWAFGSVTDKIVRSSPVPVMIVSPGGCRIST